MASRITIVEETTPGAIAALATVVILEVAIQLPGTVAMGARAPRGHMIGGMSQGTDSEAAAGTVTPIATIVATRGAPTGTALETIAMVAMIVVMTDVMIGGVVDAMTVAKSDEMIDGMADEMASVTMTSVTMAATLVVAVMLIGPLIREMRPAQTNQSRMLNPAMRALR